MATSEMGLQLTTSFPLNKNNSKVLITGLSQDYVPLIAVRSRKDVIYLDVEDWTTLKSSMQTFSDFFNGKEAVSPSEINLNKATIYFIKFTHKMISIGWRTF